MVTVADLTQATSFGTNDQHLRVIGGRAGPSVHRLFVNDSRLIAPADHPSWSEAARGQGI